MVVGITGLLTSLLLPAVQSAREGAHRTQCANNLKQIGLGIQAHVTAHRHFPTNGWGFLWIGDPDRGFGSQQPGGWVYNILPYVEEESLRLLGKRQPSVQKRTSLTSLLAAQVPLFRCPSRPVDGLLPANPRLRWRNAEVATLVFKTDYAINEGDWISDTDGGPTFRQLEREKYQWANGSKITGVSFQRSAIRPSQILDGLSHTYLVGEKHVATTGYDNYSDPGYDQPMFTGVDYDLNRWTNLPPWPDNQVVQPRGFGSPHEFCFFVFCDGRVDAITYEIDSTTHQALGNRRDGKHVFIPQ